MSSPTEDLRSEIAKGSALIVVGAGISIGATRGAATASWIGLLKHGVDRCQEIVTQLPIRWKERTLEQVESGDITEIVLAAQNIAERLGAPHSGEYRKWLRESVGTLNVDNSETISAIQALNLPIATTNYDSLLTSITGRPPVTWRTASAAQRWARNDQAGILHLHGHWEEPESVVLGIRSYDEILHDEAAQALLKMCLYFRTLVFVGFGQGLTDPNFRALLDWSRKVLGSSEYCHYRIVREADLVDAQRVHSTDRIKPISYGSEYDDLPRFLRDLGKLPAVSQASASGETKLSQLIRGRSDLARRKAILEQEEDNLESDEYFLRLLDIAKAMAAVGATKNATSAIQFKYGEENAKLSPPVRISVGLQLARWFLDDQQYEFARRVLEQLRSDGIVENAAMVEKRDFFVLIGDCYFHLFARDEAIDAYRHAIGFTEIASEQAPIKLRALEASLLFSDRLHTEGLHGELSNVGVRKADAQESQIIARCKAMAGKTSEADSILFAAINSAPGLEPADRMALQLRRAELMHNDGKDSDALQILESIQSEGAPDAPPEWENILRRNVSAVGFALWRPEAAQQWQDFIEEQRIAGTQLRDTQSVLDAKAAAENGKHYDALPPLWHEFIRTYRQGCWPIWRWASKNLSVECLAVGFFEDALHFGVIALDIGCCSQAAVAISRRADVAEIERVIAWIVANANPRRFAIVACSAIEVLADILTDQSIMTAFDWLFPFCSQNASNQVEKNSCSSAWKAMAKIAERLDSSRTEKLVRAALAHTLWTDFSIERETLRVVVANTARNLSDALLTEVGLNLAHAVVSNDSKTTSDYSTTINALTYIWSLCDAEVRTQIDGIVYPKGARLTPELIAAANKICQRNLFPDGLDSWAKRVTEELRLEVQHLGPDQKPTPISSSLMQFQKTNNDGSTHFVHIRSEIAVEAAILQRQHISDDVFSDLIEALCDGISNTGNSLSNRIHLVQTIESAASNLTDHHRNRLSQILIGFVNGEIHSEVDNLTESDAHPLSRYRMNVGKPSELVAVSLEILAKIEKANTGPPNRQLRSAIVKALQSDFPLIRRFAFYAWSEVPQILPDAIIHMIMATIDANEDVAVDALKALANAKAVGMRRREWHGLLSGCESASKSSNSALRRAAGTCLTSLRAMAPSKAISAQIDQLLVTLANDACYSVRQSVEGPIAEPVAGDQ